MSASMLGVSFSAPETQLHGGKRHNSWPLLTSGMVEVNSFSFGPVFSPYQQKQSPVSTSPIIEDEETRHEFLPHIYGNGSQPSQKLPQTFSAFQSWNKDAAVSQQRVSSLNGASGFNAEPLNSAFQKLQVGTDNQRQEVRVNCSSFSPYAEHSRYSGQPQATHRESTPASTSTGKSESEQPTDLSIPKIVPLNWHGERAADVSQHIHHGRSESPTRGLTYTHLSDVSNDSEEDLDENRNVPKTFNRGFAKKRFETLRPDQLALPWKSTHPIVERPNISKFDCRVSYAQMIVMDRASYIMWLLFCERVNEFYRKLEKQKPKIIELGDDSPHAHNDTIRSEGNVAGGRVQPPDGEEYEVIDLTLSDYEEDHGMESEQLHIQPPPSNQQLHDEVPNVEQAPSNQQILVEIPNVEQAIQHGALSRQGPTSSASMHLESSTVSVDSIILSEEEFTAHNFLPQPSPSGNTSAQQNYCFASPMLEDHSDSPQDKYPRQQLVDAPLRDTTPTQKSKKRPYREPKAVSNAAHCSGPKQLRRSPRFQSTAKEPTCSNKKRNKLPRNHEARCKPKPTNQKAQCMEPRLQPPAIKRATPTIKKNREPWNHKGLWRFVAQNAFKLPRHVWIQRKDGEPRRSRRVAKILLRNRYLLRSRLHTKS